VTVTLKGVASHSGVLGEPLVGLFDFFCNPVMSAFDTFSHVPRLTVVVPPDGILFLGATAFPDFQFVGVGEGHGGYELKVARFAAIGSISGRLVDAVSGLPLDGTNDFFLSVQLYRCNGSDCSNFVASSSTGPDGRFRFTTDGSGLPLEAGTYKIEASANEYHPAETEPFPVGVGQNVDIGDLALEPFPIRVSEIRPCGALPPEGGTCRYSVRVTNRLATAVDGAVWSIVNGSSIGSLAGSTTFQTGSPRGLTLEPGAFKIVHFSFNVPSTVADGASICAQAVVGDDRTQPFFSTVGMKNLFCIQKGFTGGFRLVSGREAAKLFRQVNGHVPTPTNRK
jgi:hypothetical protein